MYSNSKPFLVSTWYRPPNSNVDKFNYFETFIDMLDAENVEYYVLGDLNCDLGSPDLDSNSRSLIGITELYGLHQLINEPTRITETSSTMMIIYSPIHQIKLFAPVFLMSVLVITA